jgi:hypothetical protein
MKVQYVTEKPTSGFWRVNDEAVVKGDSIADGNSVTLKYVCVQEGHAAPGWWEGNEYKAFDNVMANSNAYECMGYGVSGSTAPSGTGPAPSNDGNLMWRYIGPCALFAPIGYDVAVW